MELKLTGKAQRLLELLMEIPPKFEDARSYLEVNQLSPDEVTRVANIYADKCFLDFDDYLFETYPDCDLSEMEIPTGTVPELHSAYIYDVVKLLLQFGLNPNAVYATQHGNYNIMNLILYIDHGYLAADTMVLLLESGGDPNLVVELETIYECVLDDVRFGAIEQEIRWRYDSWIHLWMVLLAFGGKVRGRSAAIKIFREYDSKNLFDIKKLKNHRDYCFGLSIENYECVIHLYNKNTFWEVARM